MNLRPCLYCLVILGLLALPASAQTRFFSSGQDGHSAILQAGVSKVDHSLAGAYSHIWNGRFELGLFAGHSWLDDPDGEGWFYGPALGVGLLKPGKRFPIGLDLQGQFQISDIQARHFSDARAGSEGQFFQADAIFYGPLLLSPGVTLYPTGMVSYLTGSAELDGGYWVGSATADVDEVAFSLGLSLVARDAVQINIQGTSMAGEMSAVLSVGVLKKGPVANHRPREKPREEEPLDRTLPY